MKKTFNKIVGMVLSAIAVFGMFGCKRGPVEIPNTDTDGKRIEIKATIAGFGVDWLADIVEKFNEVYADEGYVAVVTQQDTVVNAINELVTPKECTTDIYFQYADLIDIALNKSRAILKSEKALLADITDALNSPAIGTDKKEHGDKLIDRIVGNLADSVKYTGKLKGYNGLYGIPWQGGTTGVYINKNVLAKFGYTLDNILTTDDFIDVIRKMAPEPTEENLTNNSLMFPVSWSGKVAPGYWQYLFDALLCQYEGLESYNNFYGFIPDEGDVVSNGYSVYEKKGILESLKVLDALLDKDLAAPGTTSRDHIQMQAAVATGKAFMCVTGDWIYKELEADYSSKMSNVIAIKTPVISALGVKLGLCGKTHNTDDNCAACNEKLRNIVKAVDAGTDSDAKIASDVGGGTTEEKVARIREARGYYDGGYYSTVAMIPAFSDAVKGAKLFLRFMYSDECMKLYRAKTYVDLPARYIEEPEKDSRDFVQAIYDRVFGGNGIPFTYYNLSPIRRVAGVRNFPNEGSTGAVVNGLTYSHSHASKGQYSPSEIYQNNITFVKASWGDYLREAGLDAE